MGAWHPDGWLLPWWTVQPAPWWTTRQGARLHRLIMRECARFPCIQRATLHENGGENWHLSEYGRRLRASILCEVSTAKEWQRFEDKADRLYTSHLVPPLLPPMRSMADFPPPDGRARVNTRGMSPWEAIQERERWEAQDYEDKRYSRGRYWRFC
jgi:hypothetical protein